MMQCLLLEIIFEAGAACVPVCACIANWHHVGVEHIVHGQLVAVKLCDILHLERR